jgi:membrane-associated phospholipid phosphatase
MTVLVLAATGFGPVASLLLGRALVPSLALSVLTGLAFLAARRRPGRGPVLLLAVLLAAAVPVQYAATGAWIAGMDLAPRDETLLALDRALLSFAFPDGQVAVAIDRSDLLGPHAPLGRVATEVFQVAYFSYYVWGYGLFLLLAARYLRAGAAGDPAGAPAQGNLCAWLCAWVGAYLVNYVLYVLVPAWGPWLTHPALYTHDLEGLLLTGPIRALIAANLVTPDCFPSGHTALSWIAALGALRLAPRYGRFALAAAVPITLSTVGLRYHYAVDVLAALPLVLLGLTWGGFLRRRRPAPRRPAPAPGASR